LKAFGELLSEKFDVFGGLIPKSQPLPAFRIVRGVKNKTLLSVFNSQLVKGARVGPPKISRFQRVG
jgi:hypothetical protein